MSKFILHNSFPFLSLMMAVAIACSSSRSAGSESQQEGNGPEDQGEGDLRKVEVQKEGWNEKASDPFDYEKVSVNGDRMELHVRYSGGCEKHRFRLLTKKEYSKSDPPSVGLFLFHNANGDACRSLITDTLSYDLKKLRRSDTEELILELEGHSGQLRYVYR